MGIRFGIAIALLLFGCGAEESAADRGGSNGTGGKSFGDGGLGFGGAVGGGTYPSGPYGTEPGDVLADLELFGYLRNDATGVATSVPIGPLSFGAIRDSTDKTHVLIHVSGFT